MRFRHFETNDSYRWRPVFAWWPVKTISGKYVWLREVYKQRYWATFGEGIEGNFQIDPCIEYGDLFDVMKDVY